MKLGEGGSLKTTQNQTHSSIFKSPSWATVGGCWSVLGKYQKRTQIGQCFNSVLTLKISQGIIKGNNFFSNPFKDFH